MTLTTGAGTTGGTPVQPDPAPSATVPSGATSAPHRPADPTGTTAPAVEPGVARALVMGTLFGFVAVVAVVTGGGIVSGLEPMGALGLGVFIGMWSGAGFGFMTAGSLSLARQTDAQHAAARR